MSAIEVISEERTYRPDVELSYFKDLIDAERGGYGAGERLERHHRETRDEIERRDRRAAAEKPEELEFRTDPNTTAGQGGNFAPPLWLIDRFATAPRAGRVLSAKIPSFALPEGVHSVNLPRLTTGNAEGSVNDLGADPSTDAVDASVACNVVTVSGHGDVALQLLDQSPPGAHLDWAFFKDLTEAYDGNLEYQLINGSTSLGQLPGLLNVVASTNKVVYTSGSPVATSMFTYLGQLCAALGNNRKFPPECWLMTTSRLAWLGSSEDTQNRPLMITDKDGAGETDLLSFPIALNDAIPTNLGAGLNQDVILVVRPSDMVLLESTPRARVHLDVLSGTLQARIQLHHYVAALVRYPTAVATLTGSGMVVQSGF